MTRPSNACVREAVAQILLYGKAGENASPEVRDRLCWGVAMRMRALSHEHGLGFIQPVMSGVFAAAKRGELPQWLPIYLTKINETHRDIESHLETLVGIPPLYPDPRPT